MNTYTHYYQLIEKAIAENKVIGNPIELYEPVNYMMGLGGKRLRPVLVLMANELFGGNGQDALPAALAVEMFHNFSLVHDDIMDKALIRRNQPTVHVKWNETIAILSGDLMMIKATDLLCETKTNHLKQLIHAFNKTAIEVCEGQQLDMNFETRSDVTAADYLEMISLKTAVLLGGSLQIGAMIAGASAENTKHIYEFGKHIGIAFQIQDDILDSFGEGEKTGKKVGGDIATNKKTILLIEAFAKANPAKKAALNHWLNQPQDNADKIKEILGIFHNLQVRNSAESLKETYLQKAFTHLSAISVPEDNKKLLQQTANELMQRMG